MKNTSLTGFLHALAAAAYISLVTFVMTHAERWFGRGDDQYTSIAALMLFVLSAAVMGSLFFLRPVLWYINDTRREAVSLLIWTIASFFVLTVIVFLVVASIH